MGETNLKALKPLVMSGKEVLPLIEGGKGIVVRGQNRERTFSGQDIDQVAISNSQGSYQAGKIRICDCMRNYSWQWNHSVDNMYSPVGRIDIRRRDGSDIVKSNTRCGVKIDAYVITSSSSCACAGISCARTGQITGSDISCNHMV